MTLAQLIEDVLQLTRPRDDRPDTQDVQFEELSPLEPSFGVVSRLLCSYGASGLVWQV